MIEATIAKYRARYWAAKAKRNGATELAEKRRHRIAVVEGMLANAEHAHPSGPSKPIEIHIERWYVPSSWPRLSLKRKKCRGWELFSDKNNVSGEKRRVYLLDNGKFATDARLRKQAWISHAHPTRTFNPWVCVQWDMPDLEWCAIEAAANKLKSFTND